MTYRIKYRIANTVAVLSILAAAQGLSTLASEVRAERSAVPGATFLFMSAAVGIIATICRAYYKTRREVTLTDQQKIAVETLAKIGEKKKNHN